MAGPIVDRSGFEFKSRRRCWHELVRGGGCNHTCADLIITSTVNAGAEVIADGNIHVYGALRGRAIAGGADNMEARVFALNFDPELVSIAGFYAVREGFPAAQIGKAMQVRLVGERMHFDPIT
jgi:septum site-determining protein MinC